MNTCSQTCVKCLHHFINFKNKYMYYELNYHNDFTQLKRIIQDILEKKIHMRLYMYLYQYHNSDGVDLHDFFFVFCLF